MSDNIKRRMFRRLGVVLVAVGVLVLAAGLGLIDDGTDTSPASVIGALVMLGGGTWSIITSRRFSDGT